MANPSSPHRAWCGTSAEHEAPEGCRAVLGGWSSDEPEWQRLQEVWERLEEGQLLEVWAHKGGGFDISVGSPDGSWTENMGDASRLADAVDQAVAAFRNLPNRVLRGRAAAVAVATALLAPKDERAN